MRSFSLPILLLALGLGGCGPELETPSLVLPPCSDGTWGAIADPDHAVHVSPGATGISGTSSDPVADIATALALIEGDPDLQALALWPGEHDGPLYLDISGDGSQPFEDLAIQGCNSGESFLVATDDTQPVLLVVEVPGVSVAGLEIQGGAQSLSLRGAGDVTLEDVKVRGAHMAAVVIDGPYTVVQADQLSVLETVAEPFYTTSTSVGTDIGIGIVVDLGSLTLTQGTVDGSTYAGIIANQAGVLSLEEVEVTSTIAASTTVEGVPPLGRGIHVQGVNVMQLTDVTVTGAQDAGIFVLQPLDLTMEGCEVEDVGASTMAASGGDGIVITGDDGVGKYARTQFVLDLDGNSIRRWEPGRAGLYLQLVDASLDGNDPEDTHEFFYWEADLHGFDTKDSSLVPTESWFSVVLASDIAGALTPAR